MSNTTATAPELTQEQVLRILTKPLEAASTFLANGPTIYDTASPLRVPKLGGPIADPGWTGESEQIPERDVEFGEVTLMPTTMKSVKVISRFSNELARQSVVALDAVIQQRIVKDVADKLDAQFWSASGDGITTPKGILAQSGTQELPVGGDLDLDDLMDAWGLALAANVNMSGLRWVMRPETFTGLRKIKTHSTGSRQYVLEPDPHQDAVFRLFGAPVTITARLPKTTGGSPTSRVVLYDASQVAVARDLAPSVKVLDQTYADTDEVGIRTVARYDMACLNAEAVVKLTGITGVAGI